jgi:hypothetical protein
MMEPKVIYIVSIPGATHLELKHFHTILVDTAKQAGWGDHCILMERPINVVKFDKLKIKQVK